MGKYVYLFSEGNKDMKELLGGKGANLCEMIHLGLPVPKGFIVTTEACKMYYKKNYLPDNIKKEILTYLKKLEGITSKKINDGKKPLLLSVRSGARASMPGMMDTILNLGLNDEMAQLYESITNKKFVYDSYRRLIMMYSDVVEGINKKIFEVELDKYKNKNHYKLDNELSGDDWYNITNIYKDIYLKKMNKIFPQTLEDQLINAINAVFRSWNNERAVFYRKMNNIPDSWGTAVNIQEMVYGNFNELSSTGVAFSRNPATGENVVYGEFMVNAQGEDLVSGVRTPLSFDRFIRLMPKVYNEFCGYAKLLEKHYKDMQDMEFTVENGKLYMLQTRNGKRTAAAAIKIALDLYKEGLISKFDAINMVSEEQIEALLHNQFKKASLLNSTLVAKGLPASPGAGSGVVCFSTEEAKKVVNNYKKAVLVREETSPEDIVGMHIASAVITLRGGLTSHAAVVARGMGKCCVVGIKDAIISMKNKTIKFGGKLYKEGSIISVDGTTGFIYDGEVETIEAGFSNVLQEFMDLVYTVKKMSVRANAETIVDVKKAISLGAQGIGLVRTEHMFFEEKKLFHLRKLILSNTEEDRMESLKIVKKLQTKDFEDLLEAVDGLPITVRYLDPPLHEFLPKTVLEITELAKVLNCKKVELQKNIEQLKETNPMMGLRGCRLLILYPEIITMQTSALITAALNLKKRGINSNIEIMIPLISDVNELKYIKKYIKDAAEKSFAAYDMKINYKIGTMLETPRACINTHEIAMEADFFSFGTNDLTQMTYGLSRDDSSRILDVYLDNFILNEDPFKSLDIKGVGNLINIALKESKCINKNIKFGLCGEHGGDAKSVEYCHNIGINYVSCSPYRIPIAALAAAKAEIKSKLKI